MSFTASVRKALARLRYPSVDADGNLVASVALRNDTIANLLAESSAGDGEVAVATDVDALIVYRGSPTASPTAYFKSPTQHIVPYNTGVFMASIPPSTLTTIDTSGTYDEIFTAQPDAIDGGELVYDVTFGMQILTNYPTYVEVRLYSDDGDGTGWANQRTVFISNNVTSGSPLVSTHIPAYDLKNADSNVRVQIIHDAGGNIGCIGNWAAIGRRVT